MLYLIATPIGNLKDFSGRAVECLQESDLILCEDTRRSAHLLNHYEIKKPLKSYHKFSEAKRAEEVMARLKEGRTIALISDAGTPAICDPGERLVRACVEESIPVVPIPGPCAIIQALVGSGLPTTPFQFIGFLPKKRGALQEAVLDLLAYSGTSICYESPRRVGDVLRIVEALAPDRPLVLARELTKKYEEFIRGPAAQLLNAKIQGEVVLLFQGVDEDPWQGLTVEDHVAAIQNAFHISQKEAIVIAAKIRPLSKREIYKKFIASNRK